MQQIDNPFAVQPYYLTSDRYVFTQYDANGNPQQPIGYVTRSENNFDQEENGGNWYFNVSGTYASTEGNGRITLRRAFTAPHPAEFWREEVDDTKAKYNGVGYASLFIRLNLTPVSEDHKPFKGVSFSWEITKETVETQQNYQLHPPTQQNPFWTSTPGAVNETSRTEATETVTFNLPDDFEQGKGDFDVFRDLSESQQVARGHHYPGVNGTFQDGTQKYGYDLTREVTEVNVYDDPGFPPNSGMKYEVITKVTITYINYFTPDFTPDDSKETSAPAAFYNHE